MVQERTLLIFLNDNGGAHQAGCPNGDLRGGKATMLEGGIAVRTALGGGYLPPQLHGLTSRTVLSVTEYATMPLSSTSNHRHDSLA